MESEMEATLYIGLYKTYMVFCVNLGPQHRSQYTLLLFTGTPKNGSLILGNPQTCSWVLQAELDR